MKKAITITILSVLSIGAVVATSVFLPAFVKNQQFSIYKLDYQQAIQDAQNNNTSFSLYNKYLNACNFSLKEAVIGTKTINNGNYIIYLGSEGYTNNRKFLYGSKSDINDFESNFSRSLETSDFGNGLEYLDNSQFKNNNKNVPIMLSFIDMLNVSDLQAKNDYDTTINKFKKLQITNDSNNPLTEEELKENKIKYNWAKSAPQFDYAPGKTYTDWEGKTHYFRSTYQSGITFNKIVDFIKVHFANLTDISTSDGIVIGYKNGQLVSTMYSGSFSSTTNNSDSTTNSSFSTQITRFTPSTEFNSTFANWIKTAYKGN